MCTCMYIYTRMYARTHIYRRLGGESNREIVSFRCVRAGEAKLRERVRASVSLFARLQNRISLAAPGLVPFVPACVLFFCEV